jgi:protein required for attachment to host cells
MSRLKVNSGDWIVVCDGTKALILENVGDRVYPNLRVKEVRAQDDPRTSEQGADAPGRAFASVGGMRSSMDQTDWHTQSEDAFLKKLVDELNAVVLSGKLKALAIIAPPRALGVMRQAYSTALRSAVIAEFARDYVNVPVDEIERRLFG